MSLTSEVRCDWKDSITLMTSEGSITQSTRQSVIAWVFVTPLRMMVWSASSGTSLTMRTVCASSYNRCSQILSETTQTLCSKIHWPIAVSSSGV